MTPEQFRRYWEDAYPGCPPVGYLLRQQYHGRWLRLHMLPASKRYPESEAEYQEILRRHNILLTDILGPGQTYILVRTVHAETATPELIQVEATEHYPSSQHVLSIVEDDSSPLYWHFFMNVLVWKSHMVDSLLRQIVDDSMDNLLFVNTERQSIYAPYDGGTDIILPLASERDLLRHRYSDWLSAHPEGL